MNTPLPTNSELSSSANWPSRFGFLFGVLLLVIAGGTATAVGFKVKQAQIVRTAELKAAFYSLVGAPGTISNPSGVLQLGAKDTPVVRNFVATYQLNEWVRKFGLQRTLQEFDSKAVRDSVNGLLAIDATEAYHATRESWALMHDIPEELAKTAEVSDLPPSQPNSSKARRIAKRYDRTFIRDVEAKLFYYLHQHAGEFRGE